MAFELAGGPKANSWSIEPGGPADGDYATAAVAAALMGGFSGEPLSGYEYLYPPAKQLAVSAQRQAVGGMQASLDELAQRCNEMGLLQGGVDTSIAGRIAFACAMDSEIQGEDVFAERGRQSRDAPGEGGPSPVTQAYSVAALLGALTASPLETHAELSDPAKALLHALARADTAQTQSAIDDIHRTCGALRTHG